MEREREGERKQGEDGMFTFYCYELFDIKFYCTTLS